MISTWPSFTYFNIRDNYIIFQNISEGKMFDFELICLKDKFYDNKVYFSHIVSSCVNYGLYFSQATENSHSRSRTWNFAGRERMRVGWGWTHRVKGATHFRFVSLTVSLALLHGFKSLYLYLALLGHFYIWTFISDTVAFI